VVEESTKSWSVLQRQGVLFVSVRATQRLHFGSMKRADTGSLAERRYEITRSD